MTSTVTVYELAVCIHFVLQEITQLVFMLTYDFSLFATRVQPEIAGYHVYIIGYDILYLQEKKELKEKKIKQEEMFKFAHVDRVRQEVCFLHCENSWKTYTLQFLHRSLLPYPSDFFEEKQQGDPSIILPKCI